MTAARIPFESSQRGARPVRNEKGIALVIVLLIVALLTITTFEFIDSVMIYSHMTSNSLNGLQASLLTRSGINIGEAVLMRDEDAAIDGFAEEWCPEPLEESCRIDETFLQIPTNMRLRIEIFDESGKMNINLTRPRNLQEAELPDPANPPLFYAWQGVLRRLMEANGIDPETVERLNDYWKQKLEENAESVDEASNTEGGGRQPTPNPQNPDQEQSGESAQQQLSAAQLEALLDFPSLDDANSVLGLAPRQLGRLRDYVTALPQRRFPRVNANTAPRQVLDAIIGDGSISESIVTQRLEVPLQPADLTQQIAGLDTQDPEFGKVGQMMWTRSYMFRVVASALVNPDPVTGLGGIGRTASMLVRRVPAPARPGSERTAGHWTLTRLDWQKEGGAKLFVEADSSVPEGGEDEVRLF
jgi:type II secretory pathway component PulK